MKKNNNNNNNITMIRYEAVDQVTVNEMITDYIPKEVQPTLQNAARIQIVPHQGVQQLNIFGDMQVTASLNDITTPIEGSTKGTFEFHEPKKWEQLNFAEKIKRIFWEFTFSLSGSAYAKPGETDEEKQQARRAKAARDVKILEQGIKNHREKPDPEMLPKTVGRDVIN